MENPIRNFFLKFLEEVFGLPKEESQIENDKLVNLGETQEEKDAISILCDDIDTYHEEMQIMEDNDIDEEQLGEYTKFRLMKFADANEPDMTDKEKEELSEDIEKALEEDIIVESQYVANDIADEEVEVDDIINNED